MIDIDENRVVVMGCGDVGPFHEPVDGYPTLAKPVLATADLRFAHAEKVYSDRGVLQVHGDGHYSRQPPRFASLLSDCGFDVVSVAGNKAMDWGAEAMLDMIELLNGMGIKTVGGGRNAEEARRPAIFSIKGVDIAFLAYSSILRQGYAATEHNAGTAPMRVDTFYKPGDWQPGTPPDIITIPWAQDLEALCLDIEATKKMADVVILSMHWGIHNIPRVLADYQRVVGKAAIKAGADMIFGHHPHIPKGIEVIDGKACFYSLSHFIWTQGDRKEPGHEGGHRHGVEHDPDYPRLPFGPDAMKSMIAKAVLSKQGVDRIGFLPVRIDTEYRPEVLLNGDPRFETAVEHTEWLSEGLAHTFTVDGDEVVVTP